MASMVVASCVAVELGLPRAGLGRAARITALWALAGVGVGVSLRHAMGLRRGPAILRVLILVPILLSALLIVALTLDARFRAHAGVGVGG
jgi:hypothetical protein